MAVLASRLVLGWLSHRGQACWWECQGWALAGALVFPTRNQELAWVPAILDLRRRSTPPQFRRAREAVAARHCHQGWGHRGRVWVRRLLDRPACCRRRCSLRV